jgi:hypothetical protein
MEDEEARGETSGEEPDSERDLGVVLLGCSLLLLLLLLLLFRVVVKSITRGESVLCEDDLLEMPLLLLLSLLSWWLTW